jgi:anti-sigma regulatory factor (Ser/Thr protein kinase)
MATEPPASPWPVHDADGHLETSAREPADIAAVRRAAKMHLQRRGCTNTDIAVLVLSELVTNAVVHAGGAHLILIACHDSWVHMSVHDRSTALACPRNDNPSIGGRGLHIVDQLTLQWGSEPLDGGKRVWAVIPCAAQESNAP